MFILGDAWEDGYLDYWRAPDELRIEVRAWLTLARLDDVYVEQPRSLRRVWNYVREVGVRETLRKIQSRLAERLRDRRVLAVGLGQVLDDGDGAGRPVVFVAPCHPNCVQRLTLPPELTGPVEPRLFERLGQADGVRYFPHGAAPAPQAAVDALAGWTRFAGRVASEAARELLRWAAGALEGLDPNAGKLLAVSGATSVRERSEAAPAAAAHGPTYSAVLFGLGNYAKTCVIPNLDPGIRVDCIHEIDPTQIGQPSGDRPTYDTSDDLRPHESYQVYLIAGYHHTHAPMAVRALRAGAFAVSEKPLATTWEQHEQLVAAVREHPGRYFAGFHMRYNPLYDLAREDLGVRPGRPINHHCIVFEIKLPRRHWYHWPTSRSRIVSNGCHWLDHFLYMNDFAPIRREELWVGCDRTINASVELENDAVCTLALTDTGSRRIGVQEHVEMRAGEVTAIVHNGSRYLAEDRFRILRRKRINRMVSSNRMYASISRRIMAGQPGDALESVQRTGELMLRLEDRYVAATKGAHA
jgi:predicted dehydrogenase